MACLDMSSSSSSSSTPTNQTSDHPCPAMSSPRISFSNDFVDPNHHHHHHRHRHQMRSEPPPPPPSSDFEFSVSGYSMMSADELFFKGRLLPFKAQAQKPTTLREELLVGDDDGDDRLSLRPAKGWKGILGLKKAQAHVGAKKSGYKDGSVQRRAGLAQEAHVSTSSQEVLNDGGSSCRDVEFGM